uniref:Tc1-like transposase DDE domain-containing protein n=1 Tax=Arundo donax TaxID=35708 RepID=A0A0A9D212_ARUDO
MTVTREISRAFLISKVIHAIAACWLREDAGQTIWIQQDNARTHVALDDEAFALAVAQSNLDIRIMNQPPNSPNMNVLDLCFFVSL